MFANKYILQAFYSCAWFDCNLTGRGLFPNSKVAHWLKMTTFCVTPIFNFLCTGSCRHCTREGIFLSQPTFAGSDKKFTGSQTIQSTNIVTDYSGNEQMVFLCKISGFIKRCIPIEGLPWLMDNVWLAWIFQSNSMYWSVLWLKKWTYQQKRNNRMQK